jgi:uncharacterized protein YcfJ
MNMNVNKTNRSRQLMLAALMMGGLVSGGQAMAGPPNAYASASGYYDNARVVASTPVYEEVNTPRQECWNEQVGYQSAQPRSYGGAIIGGIAGAILGHQVGGGVGRDAATAIGAATGAIVGNNVDNRDRDDGPVRPVYEQRCRTVDNWTHRLRGYNVVYRYQGHEYTAFLPYDPGPSVRVAVQVSLAND